MRFSKQDPRPEGLNEANDCAVRATACATGLPYEQVHAAFKAAGRPDRRGTTWAAFKQAARALLGPDVEMTRIEPEYQLIGGYRRRWRATGRPTLARFTSEHRTGRYIVIIKGHALALVDGVQLDQGPSGSRCQVQAFIKVPD
jgi:hypothetical protein